MASVSFGTEARLHDFDNIYHFNVCDVNIYYLIHYPIEF